MVNPRFLELAKRLGNKDLPKEKAAKMTPKRSGKILLDPSSTLQDSFILTYDTEFAQELIRKSNEMFAGTKAEIPLQDSGEVPNLYILKRLALITAIYKDAQLQSHGFLPITPLQSEQLLKDGNLPKPDKYWEDLALILYDRKGTHKQEVQALYESLQNHKDSFNLGGGLETIVQLDSRLLVVNAGIEKDSGMPNGVKPIVLPGLTQVYPHPILEKTGSNPVFEYGLEHGLPSEKDLGTGDRTLYLPDETEDIGLRVLCRDWSLDLGAWGGSLVDSDSNGRVNFARQGVAK